MARLARRVVTKTADQTFSAVGPADVTGMSFPVKSGRAYYFKFVCLVQSDTSTVGIRMTVTVPAVTRFGARVRALIAADGTGADYVGAVTTSDDSVIPTAVPAINTDYVHAVEGIIIPSADGNVQLRAGTETGTTNVIVRQGSIGIIEEITP